MATTTRLRPQSQRGRPGPTDAPVFHPVRSRRTFEEAVLQIAEALRAGQLGVGDRLPSERALAEELDISRPTLREAVRVLTEAQLVEVRPGSGGGIFVQSDLVPLELIAERSALRVGEVLEVLEARRLFEPRVAQLAGLYGTEEDFTAMERVVRDQEANVGDRERMAQLDYRFHRLITHATKNAEVERTMRGLLQSLDIARDMVRSDNDEHEATIDLHWRTLEAIRSGDMARIDQVMDEHLSFLEQIWHDEVGRPRLRTLPSFMVSNTLE